MNPLLLFSIGFLLCLRASSWRPNHGQEYELPASEAVYRDTYDARFAYLSTLFKGLIQAEDGERSEMVLNIIKAWGAFLYNRDQKYWVLAEELHRDYDSFLKSDSINRERRQKQCSDNGKNLTSLVSGQFRPFDSPCSEEVTQEDKVITNELFYKLLHQDVQGAVSQFYFLPIERQKQLYRIHMVILVLKLFQDKSESCVRLWEDSWQISAKGKLSAVQAYILARTMTIDRAQTLEKLQSLKVFENLLEFPHRIDVINRILISIFKCDQDFISTKFSIVPGEKQNVTKVTMHVPVIGKSPPPTPSTTEKVITVVKEVPKDPVPIVKYVTVTREVSPPPTVTVTIEKKADKKIEEPVKMQEVTISLPSAQDKPRPICQCALKNESAFASENVKVLQKELSRIQLDLAGSTNKVAAENIKKTLADLETLSKSLEAISR